MSMTSRWLVADGKVLWVKLIDFYCLPGFTHEAAFGPSGLKEMVNLVNFGMTPCFLFFGFSLLCVFTFWHTVVTLKQKTL